MKKDIKPIETYYNGYHFRSRLEARWAVYFDTMGIKYEYEKEGYNLGKLGSYLPDFWLPDVKFWAEVKPVEFSVKETEKLKELSTRTLFPSVQLVGVPEVKAYNSFIPFKVDPEYISVYDSEVTFLEYPLFINLWKHNHGTTLSHGNIPIEYAPSNLIHGVEAARSARFEFGEKPQIKSIPVHESKINKIKTTIEKIFTPKRDERSGTIQPHSVTASEIIRLVMDNEMQIDPEGISFIMYSKYTRSYINDLILKLAQNGTICIKTKDIQQVISQEKSTAINRSGQVGLFDM